MPTILLLDASNAQAQRLAGEADTTLQVCTRGRESERASTRYRSPIRDIAAKDVVQRGVLHLLQQLEQQKPDELTALITFASTSRLNVGFTQDYGSLRRSLYDIPIRDEPSLLEALRFTNAYITECAKEMFSSPVQVRVFGCRAGDVAWRTR